MSAMPNHANKGEKRAVLRLRSADGVVMEVPVEEAKHCLVLNTMLELCDNGEAPNEIIPLGIGTAEVLKHLFIWIEIHHFYTALLHSPNNHFSDFTKHSMNEMKGTFLVEFAEILEPLMEAANYLDCRVFLDDVPFSFNKYMRGNDQVAFSDAELVAKILRYPTMETPQPYHLH